MAADMTSRIFTGEISSPASSLVPGSRGSISSGIAGDGAYRVPVDSYPQDDPPHLPEPPAAFSNARDEEETSEFASAENFEGLVGDLRRTFIGWLKKVELDVRREKDKLQRSKKVLADEKTKVWRQFQIERAAEMEALRDERAKMESDIAVQSNAVNAERQEIRRKIVEDKAKAEQEKEAQRRQILLEGERFRQEYETFDLEKRHIVDSALAAENMIDLNVGGMLFETSRHNLSQQAGSFIEALLSGRHHVTRDKQGRIFFDRDPELFRSILNFLRNSGTPPIPRDSADSDALIKEAEFYGIKFFPFPIAFACGGHNGNEHLRAIEVLDIGQQCWRPCRPMETERTYFGGAVQHQRLFLFGGHNLDYKALCDTEVYDTLRDCWNSGASLNSARRNLSSCVQGERLYAIGGFDGTDILSSVECYDPRMKNWMDIAPMKTARSSATCAVLEGRIYVMGGTCSERLSTVEAYDPRMNKWEAIEFGLSKVRSAGCSASLYRHIYAIGGIDNTHTVNENVEMLEPEGTKWASVGTLPEPRTDCACIALADSICVVGGQSNEVSNRTDFYRPETDEWLPGPPMLFPRYGHCLLLASI